MADNQIANLRKGVASVTTGNDRRADTEMVLASKINWGEFISPAPLSICLLGQLLIIASDTDFSLEESPPMNGWKFVNYPGSFRSSLVQVVNLGYKAFDTAGNNMSQIQKYTQQIPQHIDVIVKGLGPTADANDIEDIVPMRLKQVQDANDECIRLSQEAYERFSIVMDVTGELLEASTYAKGKNEQWQKENDTLLAVKNSQKQELESQKGNLAKREAMMKQTLQDSQDMFKNAVNSIPSGWEMLGMNLVDSFSNMALSGISMGLNYAVAGQGGAMVAMMSDKDKGKQGGGSAQPAAPGAPTVTPAPATPDPAWAQSELFLAQVTNLDELASKKVDGKPDGNPDLSGVREGVLFIKVSITELQKKLTATTVPTQKLSALVARAIKVCEVLGTQSKELNTDPAVIATAIKEANSVRIDALQFNTEAKLASSSTPLAGPLPANPSIPPIQATPSNVGQSALNAAQTKVDQAKLMLTAAREDYNNVTDKLDQTSADLIKLIGELTNLDRKKIDFESIRRTLINGIKALAALREQWAKMVRFFQEMASLIKVSMGESVTSFVDAAKTGQERRLAGVSFSDFLRNTIYLQALETSKIAFLVNRLSGTYVEISDKYLVNRIVSLGKIVGLDPEKDKNEILKVKGELNHDCEEAQKLIAALVKKSTEDFDANIKKRVSALASSLDQALPKQDPKLVEENKKALEAGKKVVDDAKKEAVADKAQADSVIALQNLEISAL